MRNRTGSIKLLIQFCSYLIDSFSLKLRSASNHTYCTLLIIFCLKVCLVTKSWNLSLVLTPKAITNRFWFYVISTKLCCYWTLRIYMACSRSMFAFLSMGTLAWLPIILMHNYGDTSGSDINASELYDIFAIHHCQLCINGSQIRSKLDLKAV